MLIPPQDLVKYWKIVPQGVLHIGAHTGEEFEDYEDTKFGEVFWVEADPILCLELTKRFGERNVLNGLVWSSSNIDKDFYHSDNMQAASILPPKEIMTLYPEIRFTEISRYRTTTLSDLIPSTTEFNFLNLDIQGAEFEAIKGLGDLIKKIDYIYIEMYTLELYRENGYIGEVDQYLSNKGFNRVGANINPKIGWGDALYIFTADMGVLRRLTLRLSMLRFYFDLRRRHANRRARNRVRKLLLLDH